MPVFSMIAYVLVLAVAGWFLARYMTRVFSGEGYGWLAPLGVVERLIYRLCGVNPSASMGWRQYAESCLLLNISGFLFLFILLLTQQWLPLNPQHFPNLSWHLALNTAVSFVTNTNWQAYSGESTLSYFSQMIGLTVQNFLSPAVGMAVLLALIRGLSQTATRELGNFWVDTVRCCLYVLLPLSLILALILISQGVVQSFQAYPSSVGIEGSERLIPLGPAASQIAIKQLGTNGGGFFGVNSAHPFENPTPLTNFLEMVSILLIPVAQVLMFGFMIRKRKEGFVILGSMFALMLMGLAAALWAEWSVYPAAWEGKEWRNGITDSVLWATVTTDASSGSVNAMHDSLSPLAGLVTMLNIAVGEVIFGGVGVGLAGMFMMVILTVFIAGLMVGRTPEYLGKKIEADEIKLAILVIILPGTVLLIGAALSCLVPPGYATVSNAGPHGLSQILYAFASAVGNNGSAFAGLGVNTPYYNTMLATLMLIGRFVVIIPCLGLAGLLAGKQPVPRGSGTLSTDTMLFVILLTGIVLIVGALTYFPAFLLGPISEHMLMINGRTF